MAKHTPPLTSFFDGMGGSYSFGLDPACVTQALRALADAIDTGDVLVTNASDLGTVQRDDFAMRTWTFTFHDKLPASDVAATSEPQGD